MKRLLTFAKLDYITIKPYLTLKNLMIYGMTMIVMGVTTKSATAISSIILMIASLQVIYPFALGEKSNIDALYITLAISRRTVVYGRYLSVILMDILALALGGIVATLLSPVFQESLNEIWLPVLVVALFFFIIHLFQLPIYFKLGYTKAKIFVMIPYVFLFLFFTLFAKFAQSIPGAEDFLNQVPIWFSQYAVAFIVLIVASLVCITLLSITCSLKFYKKKEF